VPHKDGDFEHILLNNINLPFTMPVTADPLFLLSCWPILLGMAAPVIYKSNEYREHSSNQSKGMELW